MEYVFCVAYDLHVNVHSQAYSCRPNVGLYGTDYSHSYKWLVSFSSSIEGNMCVSAPEANYTGGLK